jgi:ATP phosphoribosyltransferase regulatory subunit
VKFPRNIEASLPKGVADFLPEKAAKIGYIQERILKVFELWGFRRIITPLLEFQDVMALAMGDDLKGKVFRFDDRQTGKSSLSLRYHPQIARIVATRMTGILCPTGSITVAGALSCRTSIRAAGNFSGWCGATWA